MIKKIKEASKNPFLRNVTTLVSGTIISQIIVVLTSPLLTRIYSVESFGLLSVFVSIASFFAVVSTGRYEYAIGLPDEDSKAKSIIRLIFTIGILISIFYFILIYFLKNIVNYVDPSKFLLGFTSYLAPLYIVMIAINSAFGYWYQRKKKYKVITFTNAAQVIITTIFSVIFGLLKIEAGMILALLIGISFTTIYFFFKDRTLKNIFTIAGNLKDVAKEYSSFPKYMIFSDLSKTASQQIIPVLFAILYSTTIVGLYSLANRMLRLPNIVITTAIGNVFRNDAIDEIKTNGHCKHLYISTFKKLLIMSVPIYTLIFIFAPFIFTFAFGEKWVQAGHFARILSVLLLVEFIATPLTSLFYVREKQKLLMSFQFINTIMGVAAIFLGSYFFGNAMYSLVLFSLGALIFNVVLLVYSYKIACYE